MPEVLEETHIKQKEQPGQADIPVGEIDREIVSPTTPSGVAAVKDRAYTRSVFQRNRALKHGLYRNMEALGLKTVPSQTNFVLVEFPGAGKTAQAASGALWAHAGPAVTFALAAAVAALGALVVISGLRGAIATSAP